MIYFSSFFAVARVGIAVFQLLSTSVSVDNPITLGNGATRSPFRLNQTKGFSHFNEMRRHCEPLAENNGPNVSSMIYFLFCIDGGIN